MKKYTGIIAFLVITFCASAQIDNTMYFMDRLPQSSYINPAQTPNCKFHIGGLIIPVFGQLLPPTTLAVNLPIDYGDVIFHGEGEYADSLITPLHPTANIDDFLKKLRRVNYVTTDVRLDILTLGFRAGENNFFTVDLSERMFASVGLPGDLFRFAAKGNDVVRDADFTGLGARVMYMHQLAVGYKRQISPTLSMGLRAKLLVGVANAQTSSSNLSLSTAAQTNYIKVKSEYVINSNVPLEVSYDEDGYIDGLSFTAFDSADVSSIIKDYAFPPNYGAALDFGFSKDINSFFTCFFSVEDFGMVLWNKNANQFTLYDEDSIKFEGINISNLDIEDFADVIDLDSIVAHCKEITYDSASSYKTILPTKLYAGMRYHLAKRISLGALAKFEFLPHKVRPSVTLTANFKPFKFTAATLSYSWIDGNINNLGLGFTVHPGFMQWYFVSDNLIGAALFPTNTRSVSMRVGCNLVFGCVKKYKGDRRSDSKDNSELLKRQKRKNKGVVPYSEHHKNHTM